MRPRGATNEPDLPVVATRAAGTARTAVVAVVDEDLRHQHLNVLHSMCWKLTLTLVDILRSCEIT